MNAEPRLLVVWGQYPRWIPPVRFSRHQVTPAATVKPGLHDQSEHNFNYFEEFTPDGWLNAGSFDLYEYCERHGLGHEFDFILVFAEQDMGLLPANLGAFRCPAILLVGDTHHFRRPISTLISYIKQEKIGMLTAQFASHHLHWFIKAGVDLCAWTPGLITRHAPRPLRAARDDTVTFVGHSWDYHYHRYCLLGTMRQQGLPLEVKIGTREEAADSYSRSVITFNCSLNADINIRNFEVLSSGGFLLADELPRLTGFDELFRPGRACDVYRTPEELLDKISFYRRNPQTAYRLALEGNRLFNEKLAPGKAIGRFKEIFFGGKTAGALLPPDPRCHEQIEPNWQRRLAMYEEIQELHRTQNTVRVLVGADADWVRASDFIDLPFVSLHAEKPAFGAGGPGSMAGEHWDYVVRS